MKRWLWILGSPCAVVLVVYSVWGYSVRSNAEATLTEAKRLIAEKRGEAARAALNNLLRFKPDEAEATFLIGRSLQLEGKLAAAAEAYARIPVEAKAHRQASLARGIALLHDAQFEAAENAFRDHLELYPESKQARDEVKWLLFNQLRGRELEVFLKGQLFRHLDDESLLFDLLFTEIRKQIPRETMANLATVNELKPGQANVVLALAHCFWKTAQTQSAIDCFRQALQLRPDHLETRLLAAEFQMEQGQLDATSTLLTVPDPITTGMPIDWRDDDRWCWLSSQLAQLKGDDETAQTLAKRALELRPNEREYLHGYQTLLVLTGQTESAEPIRKRAAELQACRRRLEILVLGGDLDNPTADACGEVAALVKDRGESAQADGWSRLADHLRNDRRSGGPEVSVAPALTRQPARDGE
jgi:tetratricopeptide (TPR) repeat protein